MICGTSPLRANSDFRSSKLVAGRPFGTLKSCFLHNVIKNRNCHEIREPLAGCCLFISRYTSNVSFIENHLGDQMVLGRRRGLCLGAACCEIVRLLQNFTMQMRNKSYVKDVEPQIASMDRCTEDPPSWGSRNNI